MRRRIDPLTVLVLVVLIGSSVVLMILNACVPDRLLGP
jgi:hypothetical protein